MTTFRTITSGLVLTIAVAGAWQAGGAPHRNTAHGTAATRAEVSVSSDPTVTVAGGDADDHRRLEEALERFRAAGLDLPDLDARFLDDPDGCRGHYGLFLPTVMPWRVLICTDLEFVPTHELAHAWEAAHLDENDRSRYVELRGLSNWNDARVPWVERGMEDAAFVIHKNLTTVGGNLESTTWQERIAAYEFLTGRPSPLSG